MVGGRSDNLSTIIMKEKINNNNQSQFYARVNRFIVYVYIVCKSYSNIINICDTILIHIYTDEFIYMQTDRNQCECILFNTHQTETGKTANKSGIVCYVVAVAVFL